MGARAGPGPFPVNRRDTGPMSAIAVVVIAVAVLGVAIGLYVARQPVNWDELGGGDLQRDADAGPDSAGSQIDDEAELRALIADKRARRGAPPREPISTDGPEWDHVDPEVVQEARDLVARRRARLQRTLGEAPDEHKELVRLLGPPHV
jgi:hypothetical protein